MVGNDTRGGPTRRLGVGLDRKYRSTVEEKRRLQRNGLEGGDDARSKRLSEGAELISKIQRNDDFIFKNMFDEIRSDRRADESVVGDNIKRNLKFIMDFVDDLYGLLNSTNSIELRDYCINKIENWRYFLHSNGFRLSNHVYGLDNCQGDVEIDSSRFREFDLLVDAGRKNSGRLISGWANKDTEHKTVSITVERRIKVPRYGKYIKRTKKYLIHDEYGIVNCGDMVFAVECRPISARKHFRLLLAKNSDNREAWLRDEFDPNEDRSRV